MYMYSVHVAWSLSLYLLTPTFRYLWRHVMCYKVHWSRPDWAAWPGLSKSAWPTFRLAALHWLANRGKIHV